MAKKQHPYAYDNLLSPKSWLVEQKGFDRSMQALRETQFTQGNGYLCCRGILEELPYDANAGTYIGGIYDRTGAQITELVNLPNPIVFRIDTHGEKLDPVAMDIVHHRRTLDMHKAIVYRHTTFRSAYKKHIDLTSRRFVSLANKNLIVMEVEVTPLDEDMTFNFQTMIDAGVSNRGALTEGRKRHFEPHEVEQAKDHVYLCVETFEKKVLIAYASALEVCRGNRCHTVGERAMNLRVKKNETITFRKYIVVKSSRHVRPSELKRTTVGILKSARRKGFTRLLDEHEKAWLKRWQLANVDIEGDPEAARALRFNTYHLIIAGNTDDDDVSIGARTLSGEGYRGHIFWDTELFLLPFFIYNEPQVARNLLMYRVHRLTAARNNAAARGYKGALYPWESADTGEECTPSWAKNFDGKIIRIVTMDEEHHINADIAYAINNYVDATGDIDFMWSGGLEVLLETARFWASRVIYNTKQARYEIDHVMGPDEFHEDVNNNAYTNAMAAFNLEIAVTWAARLRRERPAQWNRIAGRIKLAPKEVLHWRQIAERMYFPYSKKRRLIEPFDGFFRLRDHRICQLNEHFMPVLPSTVEWEEIGKTQFIKQADVVMLLYLQNDRFSQEEKKRDYYFNERHTLHKSSLSPAIHSIVGLEVGDEEKALHYFAHALSSDLQNIHGNTPEGIHAASAGATWQAAIMGFAGMRRRGGILSFTPHLPLHWKGMHFCVVWHGCRLRVSMTHARTEICLEDRSKRGPIAVEVYGELKELTYQSFVQFLAPKRASRKSTKVRTAKKTPKKKAVRKKKTALKKRRTR